jgi:DNA-binding winged helix-turn-helix (wHTH) protein
MALCAAKLIIVKLCKTVLAAPERPQAAPWKAPFRAKGRSRRDAIGQIRSPRSKAVQERLAAPAYHNHRFERPHTQEGNNMLPPSAMPNLRRETVGQDGSPTVSHWASPSSTDATLEFGRFRVLLRQRRLLACDVPVELGTRAFDILMVLIEADGALVTKDELQNRVWPGIVVAQDNLKVQIFALRKALGEDCELIRTEHGRGYRFTAAVRSTVAASECLPAPGGTTPQKGRNAASPMDLSAIASRLSHLETQLAEALYLLGTYRNSRRLQRNRYGVGRSTRRTRGRRPVGPVLRRIDLHEKLLHSTC